MTPVLADLIGTISCAIIAFVITLISLTLIGYIWELAAQDPLSALGDYKEDITFYPAEGRPGDYGGY